MRTRICGSGSALPKLEVTNDDLSKIMDTSDEWIKSRTGICSRHLATDETLSSLAADAALQALEEAGIAPEELDMILAATLSADRLLPTLSCELQQRLGAGKAVAFDINAACSGFLFALQTADVYIKSGQYQKILVVGGEILSKLMDWEDRSTCVLFGDGAGAAVVCPDETFGILSSVQGSDGARGEVLSCENRKNNNPYVTNSTKPSYVSMDGQEVYKFAVSTVPASIHRVLEKAGLGVGDIKYFVLHQANLRIIRSVAKRLKADADKFPVSLDHCGNISAASVPVLLDEMNRKGMLSRGDKIVMSGFGGGLTWASAVVEW